MFYKYILRGDYMKVYPLSPSRLDMMTIQTDFSTNQLTLELSEAELRAKINELINQGNGIDDIIQDILVSLTGMVTQKVLREINKLDLSNFTGSWHGVERPSLTNEGISGAVDNLEMKKQDKTDNSLETDSKIIPLAINEVKLQLGEKSSLIVCDEIPSEKKENTFYFKITDKQSAISGSENIEGAFL